MTAYVLSFLLLLCLPVAHAFVATTGKAPHASTGTRGGRPTLIVRNESSDGGENRKVAFPVLKQIQGIDWTGDCRYVGSDLQPASFLLKGGLRYDLEEDNVVKLTSFLTFPSGKTRQVEMRGERGSLERASMRLDPTEEEGPIYMVITEVAPDTVLVNEVEKASGKIVMTSSLSITEGTSPELIQISHELGGPDTPVEGHQVWRLKKARRGEYEDNATNSIRDTTGV